MSLSALATSSHKGVNSREEGETKQVTDELTPALHGLGLITLNAVNA